MDRWRFLSGDLNDVAAGKADCLPVFQASIVEIKNFIDDADERLIAAVHIFIAVQVLTDSGDAHPEGSSVLGLGRVESGG